MVLPHHAAAPRDSNYKRPRIDSERRYGLGYVLAWSFLEDLEEIWVRQALGAGFLNRLQNLGYPAYVKFHYEMS